MTEDRHQTFRVYGPPLLLGLIVPVTIVIAINQWSLSADFERLEKLVRENDARHQSGIYNVLGTQQKLWDELNDRIAELRIKNLAYFPPGAFGKDDERAAFLVGHLRGLRADSLWSLAELKDAGPTVRLLWLPETGRPTTVRLLPQDRRNTRFGLEFAQLAEPDTAGNRKIVTGNVSLLPEHAADLNRRLDEIGLWSAPAHFGDAPSEPAGRKDRWAVEGVNQGRYHLLVGGATNNPAFQEFSKVMLGYGRSTLSRDLRIP